MFTTDLELNSWQPFMGRRLNVLINFCINRMEIMDSNVLPLLVMYFGNIVLNNVLNHTSDAEEKILFSSCLKLTLQTLSEWPTIIFVKKKSLHQYTIFPLSLYKVTKIKNMSGGSKTVCCLEINLMNSCDCLQMLNFNITKYLTNYISIKCAVCVNIAEIVILWPTLKCICTSFFLKIPNSNAINFTIIWG